MAIIDQAQRIIWIFRVVQWGFRNALLLIAKFCFIPHRYSRWGIYFITSLNFFSARFLLITKRNYAFTNKIVVLYRISQVVTTCFKSHRVTERAYRVGNKLNTHTMKKALLMLSLALATLGSSFAQKQVSTTFSVKRNHTEIFTKGANGNLSYFYAEPNWKKDNSSFSASKVSGDISAVYEPQREHSSVFFKGEDGYLHYYYVNNGAWAHDGESFKAAKVDGAISSVYEPQRKHCAVFFKGIDGNLHYYYVANGQWQHDGTSFSAAKVDGAISSVFEVQRNHSSVFFKGTDGKLHFYYVDNGAWKHDGTSFSASAVSGDISAVYVEIPFKQTPLLRVK